eukprot:361720-Chlamydomonas_euryale.AAC.8
MAELRGSPVTCHLSGCGIHTLMLSPRATALVACDGLGSRGEINSQPVASVAALRGVLQF